MYYLHEYIRININIININKVCLNKYSFQRHTICIHYTT